MEPAICFEMLYPGLSAQEKIRRVAEHGFSAVEFWAWRDKDIDAIQSVCRDTGVRVVNFSAQRRGDLIDVTTHDTIMEDLESSLNAASQLGTKTLMVLSNELGDEGVVIRPHEESPRTKKSASLVQGIRRILKNYPDDMTLVIEPLNTITDHVGYFLSSVEDAARIVEEIGDARLGVLCDLYHQGVMGDDPVQLIQRHAKSFGYVHVAEFPGRHEPGNGTRNWEQILNQLPAYGYDGYVGFEFEPESDSDKALETITTLWRRIGE